MNILIYRRGGGRRYILEKRLQILHSRRGGILGRSFLWELGLESLGTEIGDLTLSRNRDLSCIFSGNIVIC